MTIEGDPPPEDRLVADAERDLDRVEASLAAIERAIAGLDDGTYGNCEICGREIGDDRLSARATERRCAEHDEA